MKPNRRHLLTDVSFNVYESIKHLTELLLLVVEPSVYMVASLAAGMLLSTVIIN